MRRSDRVRIPTPAENNRQWIYGRDEPCEFFFLNHLQWAEIRAYAGFMSD